MNILLIDKNIRKYQPQVKWDMLDEELNINKFEKVYIFVDSETQVNNIKRDFENVIFVSEKDLNIRNSNFIIKKMAIMLEEDYDFRKKILKHQFISDYLLGR